VLLAGGVTTFLVSSPPQDPRAPIAVGPHAADFAAWWKDCAPHWDHGACNPVPADTLTFCNALLPPGLPPLTQISVSHLPLESWPTTNPGLSTDPGGGLSFSCGAGDGTNSWSVLIQLPSKNNPSIVSSDPCINSQPGGQCVTAGSGKVGYNSDPKRTFINYGSAAVSLMVINFMPDKTLRDAATLALFANVAQAVGITVPDLTSTTPTTTPTTAVPSVTAVPPTTPAAAPVFTPLRTGSDINRNAGIAALPHPQLSCPSGYAVDSRASGHLTGRAAADIVVVLTCAGATGGAPRAVEAYIPAAAGQPAQQATLVPEPTDTPGSPFADNVTVSGNVVTVSAHGYGPKDPFSTPSWRYTQRFTFNGDNITAGPLVTTSSTETTTSAPTTTSSTRPRSVSECEATARRLLRQVIDGTLTVAQAAAQLPPQIPHDRLQSAVDGYHRYAAEGLDGFGESTYAMTYFCSH
jgi:hypothetical protein